MTAHPATSIPSHRASLQTFIVALHLACALFSATAIGAPPTDFTVQSPSDGKAFTLSSARGRFVALHFLLKTECPYCLKHTHDYAVKSASTPDVTHVFLKPDSADEIKAWAAKANTADAAHKVPVYRDPEARLAAQFDIPNGYAFHGQIVHFPALIILDPSGKEVFRYIGKNNSDRFTFEQFTAKLAELKRAPSRSSP